jgi:2-polyprenyl-6-methoxyphenol hydroxylase-like FAD-dependent oxidoreductase
MTGTNGPHPVGEHAVVLGASMAGLCAARVLADRFERVSIIDRDAFPTDPRQPRGQVPQGRHPHLLHVAGARLLAGWFPGIVGALHDGGAVELDLCADFYWYQEGGVARRPTTDLVGPAASRPFLEATVRARVAQLANVEIRDGCAAAGAELDGDRMTGVYLDGGTVLRADLTVDATGRRARSLGWLAAAGYSPPPVDTVEVDTRYVTQVYRRDPRVALGWKAAAVIDDPTKRRLAMALPAEGDRWLVLLGGLNGEAPPTQPDERLAWAESLPSSVIADLMAACPPVGDVVTHRFPANQRRRIEKMRRFPAGWTLLGDAVCSFDPIYGQGMTSAALQAAALGACLDHATAVDRRFARRYHRSVARVVAAPWSVAVGGDFAYPGTTGPKPAGTDLLNRYMRRVTIAAQHDDRTARRFNEVVAMVRRPESLLTPRFALRALRTSRQGPTPCTYDN